MKNLDIPFNVYILDVNQGTTSHLKPVTSMDIFDDASTRNYHPEGLYSTEIFGRAGESARNTQFSYIDIKIPVFHPAIYRSLVDLKDLYEGIMAGTAYAVWDDELKDFDRSDEFNGNTGFSFFLAHWEKIVFRKTKSDNRDMTIEFIEKYKSMALTDRVLVLPAGLRDIEIGDDGRVQRNEINAFYVKFLSLSNTISRSSIKLNPDILDTVRSSLQNTFVELFELFESMLDGKQKMILGKWAARRLHHGTRNVLTAQCTPVEELGDPGSIQFNDTSIGVYQALKALMPVARYKIRNGFISTCFTYVGGPVKLVDKKTLAVVDEPIDRAYYDIWMTDEGVEKLITMLSDEHVRDKYIEINGRYLGLIYKGPDMTFKLLHGIDELPEGFDKKYVSPITYCELMYIAGYQDWNKYPIFVTRYPVNNIGSIYASFVKIKTTVKDERRHELGEDWLPLPDTNAIAYSFPIPGPYLNSLVPHSAKIRQLGADYDGDTGSGNCVMSSKAVNEVKEHLTKRKAYLNSKNRFISSTAVATVELVYHNLTRD